MMAARTLSSAPSMLPLYARAAASMIPGASLLPFVPGRGKEIPDVDLTLAGVRVDPDKVAAAVTPAPTESATNTALTAR